MLVDAWLRFRRFSPHFVAEPQSQRAAKGKMFAAHDPARLCGIEFYVERAAALRPAAILVLVDSDGSCPMSAGETLLARARTAAAHIPLAVILPHREFEAWFLADLPHLRHLRELRPGCGPTEGFAVEGIQDAKKRFGTYLPNGYGPMTNQRHFSGLLSFRRGLCRRSRSFRKLLKELELLTKEARRHAHPHP